LMTVSPRRTWSCPAPAPVQLLVLGQQCDCTQDGGTRRFGIHKSHKCAAKGPRVVGQGVQHSRRLAVRQQKSEHAAVQLGVAGGILVTVSDRLWCDDVVLSMPFCNVTCACAQICSISYYLECLYSIGCLHTRSTCCGAWWWWPPGGALPGRTAGRTQRNTAAFKACCCHFPAAWLPTRSHMSLQGLPSW